MKIGLIITVAGSGIRFGEQTPKQFVKLEDEPLIVKTCRCFQDILEIQHVSITINSENRAYLNSCLKSYGIKLPYKIVGGGETRMASVRLAFDQLPEVDYVMIHDGVRPNLSPNLLNRIISSVSPDKAVIPGIPVTDTLKRVSDNEVIETVDRSKLVRVQTPQLFPYKMLKESYKWLQEHSDVLVTDEALLVELAGYSVKVVPGEASNIKITVPEDLTVLKSLLSASIKT